ncbi:MAG: YceI family protein [Polaribacter sp.]|uniref:YceI family protein n=1 Tax=Polaribacter sp. TaxID=1920175 RepID=UPI002F35DE9C
MKKLIKNSIAILVMTFITLSFTTINNEKKAIKTEDSKVTWKGYKVTGSHQGTIAIQSGSLTFSEDKLSGGEIVIDMKSIKNTEMEGEYKGKLEGHLKSNDFFGVEKFPTATLVFNDIKLVGKNSYTATGNLTIKGKTNAITFCISVYGNKATANLKIDRSKFDVKYGSTSFFENLKDKAIYDEFDLIADLEF